MDFFSLISLIGGLTFFLYGMSVMSSSLEKMSGGKLEEMLRQLTAKPLLSMVLGAVITIAVQSSSSTTVMLVGLVNSGIMQFSQTVNVIFGANIGTTVTAWLLSLAGIDSGSLWIQLLKPSSFTPVLALVGIIFYMFSKDAKKKDYSSLKYWKSHIFRRDFLIQQEGQYKGAPLRTKAGGRWLNGYSDHLPVVMYLEKKKK